MQQDIPMDAWQYVMRNRRRKGWKNLVRVLACAVVFCTTYALILPAITMEKATVCGLEEHAHDENCYSQVLTQTVTRHNCSYETLGVHVHSDQCRDENGALICGFADFVVHTHTELCYDAEGQLICQLPEIEDHTHTDACYTQPETPEPVVHVHSESCYAVEQSLTCGLEETGEHTHTEACYTQQQVLTCGLEEGQAEPVETPDPVLVCEKEVVEIHTHSDECYETHEDADGAVQTRLICGKRQVTEHIHTDACVIQEEVPAADLQTLTCGLEESETHTHTDRCYGTWELICGKEEHTHDLLCQNDPEADVETEADWIATFADVTLTGEWDEDLLSIARSQLGYQESTRNYEVMEDGETIKGYTRYGDWYGMPYGDWCTMFVSFCLNYADIPQDAVPYEANCPDWIEVLQDEEYELYRLAGEYTPVPGDLIFFDWEEDGTADHVGIVAEIIPATEEEPEKIKTIEGNMGDQVAEQEYDMDDVVILGYAQLPEKPPTYYCGLQEHTHDASCMDENGELICGIAEHTHTDECLSETVYSCGLKEHAHDESCTDENGELVCGLEEHIHFILCTAPETHIYCWLTEHTHDESCLDETGNMVCGMDEHTHEARCCEYIGSLIVMIDTLPTSEEAEAALLVYEEAADWEGYVAYQQKVSDLAWQLHYACEEMDEEDLSLVTNYDRLMDLSWLWSAIPYAADISKVTYNPDYETDDYHTQWTTPGTWITQSTDPLIHINEAVPDEYTIDGLVIGAKSADSVIFSQPDLVVVNSAMTDGAAKEATGFGWETLQGSGFDCTYGANLVLPSDEEAKAALLGSDGNRPVYALYKNIGTYNGEIIDLKISLVEYENYVNWNPDITEESERITEGVLGFWTLDTRSNQVTYGQRLPGISVCGVSWVRVLYTFLDSNGNEINVKGSTSFYDLDYAQSVHIRAGDTKLMGIYITDVNSSVPNLDTVNSYGTRNEQRAYFENWTVDDCVLKFSNIPPETRKGNVMSGVVVYSPHGNDSGQNSEQYGDTKHAFTFTFERNNINIVYGFDKGKHALSATSTAEAPTYSYNANGGIIHSGVPVYTGSLEIRKEVTGVANAETEFRFQIEFFTTGTTIDDALDGKFGDVTIVDGVGTFTLKHGESVKISGIPIRANGTPYKITELTTDGYIVETSMTQQPKNGTLETDGPHTRSYYGNTLSADDEMLQYQIVVFENYGGPVLPQTGGAGTTTYTMAGLVLMIFSMAYLMYRPKARRREEFNSS